MDLLLNMSVFACCIFCFNRRHQFCAQRATKSSKMITTYTVAFKPSGIGHTGPIDGFSLCVNYSPCTCRQWSKRKVAIQFSSMKNWIRKMQSVKSIEQESS